MNRLFDMDNKFFTIMSKIADLMLLNILCLVCCIPIVTIGASVTALYTVALKMAKNEESYITRSFFHAFKENFKQSTIIWVIFAVVGIILYFDYHLAPQLFKGKLGYGLQVIFTAFGVVWVMMFGYVFPLQAKFVNKVKQTIKNSLLMSIRHLPYTLLISALIIFPFIGASLSGYFVLYGTFFYIIVGIALTAFINAKFFNRIFKAYIPEEAVMEERN